MPRTATYAPLPMFKILLLQRWYNLSDAAVEGALADRLSFIRFVGLSLDNDEVPDATTICRFRQSLLEHDLLKRLLDKFNHQLHQRGFLVRRGAIVDASVVSSKRRPLKVFDLAPEDRRENEDDDGDGAKEPDVTVRSDDRRKLADHGRPGSEVHAATDSRDGYGCVWPARHLTPDDQFRMEKYDEVLDDIGQTPVTASLRAKGYCSRFNRFVLQRRGLEDGIMAKASRNRELTAKEKAANRRIGSVRYKVERLRRFYKKRCPGLPLARYLGLAKVELEFFLNAMAFNLKKAVLSAG